MPRAHLSSGVAVADVFSADTYTGNGSTQTITNGINLAGNGGLVWSKKRSGSGNFNLIDTIRGNGGSGATQASKVLASDTTAAASSGVGTGGPSDLTAFNSNGYSIGPDYWANANGSTATFVSWTFRKAAKFFDMVTYTGTGSAPRNISHSLASSPGFIVIKRTDSTGHWWSWHTSIANKTVFLNYTDSADSGTNPMISAVSSTNFTLATNQNAVMNINSATYVAYLFAHEPTGVIQCDTYTGNGSATGPTVTLGWQPQFLMIKRTDSTGDWYIYDSARSTSNPRINKLLANSGAAEDTADENVDFNATSFQLKSTDAGINASAGTYIYMAIKAE